MEASRAGSPCRRLSNIRNRKAGPGRKDALSYFRRGLDITRADFPSQVSRERPHWLSPPFEEGNARCDATPALRGLSGL